MNNSEPLLPVFSIERHRLTTDGKGVTTLVGGYGCPLACKYCLNPHAWNPDVLKKCTTYTPQALYDKVKVDNLYFLATGGGITFGGGESLLHAEFIRSFREICGLEWNLTVETSLNVPKGNLLKVLDVVNDFIVDIKDLNPDVYETYTGMPIDRMLINLELLAEKKSPGHIHVRVPRISAYNTEDHILSSVEKLKQMGLTDIEVFSYIIR
ncbi:MAG: radical SAM protein [Lachnospiraceae bacterium]